MKYIVSKQLIIESLKLININLDINLKWIDEIDGEEAFYDKTRKFFYIPSKKRLAFPSWLISIGEA